MVGRQTSRACSTCRKRKIKCGLERPECLRCVAAGWQCPGYLDRFVPSHNGASSISKKQRKDGRKMYRPSIPLTPLSTADKLRTLFIQAMEGDALAAKLTMMPKMHILIHIPERIGQNEALDDAVRCIANEKCPENDLRLRQNYLTALRSLSKALASSHEAYTAENLAAASLLQMYEIHTDFDGRKWIQHARGAVKMLRLRGSAVARSRLERAVLGAEAVELFMAALTARQFRFLQLCGWMQNLYCPPRVDADRSLDKFIRVIFDGVRFENVGSFCSYFSSSCEFSKASSSKLHAALAAANGSDFLKLRRQLRKVADSMTVPNLLEEGGDPVEYAASMAVGCFLLITNSYILWSRKQLAEQHNLKSDRPADVPTDLALEQERSNLLESLTTRSNDLANLDPALRMKAAAALQVIVGSLQTTAQLGVADLGERSTLLHMLDAILEGAGWI